MRITLTMAALIVVCCGSPKSNKTNADSIEQVALSEETPPAKDDLENSEDCACSGSAYLIDPDTTGTNIRDTPNGKIIGKLKYDEDCECEIISFDQSQSGWLKLDVGGWVHGSLFAIDTRNYGEGAKVFLMSSPTDDSDVTKEFDTEKTFTIIGCCGSWLQVKDSDGTVGWLTEDMICANPLTSCS
jgi:hypothetical protein